MPRDPFYQKFYCEVKLQVLLNCFTDREQSSVDILLAHLLLKVLSHGTVMKSMIYNGDYGLAILSWTFLLKKKLLSKQSASPQIEFKLNGRPL